MTTSKTHYDVLGVNMDATFEDIRKAYRQKVRLYHPDTSKLDNAQELFIELKTSYDILSNKERRKHYDAMLKSTNKATEQDENRHAWDENAKQNPNFTRHQYESHGKQNKTKDQNSAKTDSEDAFWKTMDDDTLRNFHMFSSLKPFRAHVPRFFPRIYVFDIKKKRGLHVNMFQYLFVGAYELIHKVFFWLISFRPEVARKWMKRIILVIVVFSMYAKSNPPHINIVGSIFLGVCGLLLAIRLIYMIYFGIRELCITLKYYPWFWKR